jgi:hypothetical protein
MPAAAHGAEGAHERLPAEKITAEAAGSAGGWSTKSSTERSERSERLSVENHLAAFPALRRTISPA